METLSEIWNGLLVSVDGEEALVVGMLVVSAVTFFGSLVAVPIVVVQMKADYFVRERDTGTPATALRWLRRILKNALGWMLVLGGIAMLVLPGQGLLTMALGVSLVEFPGKRVLQLRMVKLERVHRSINWIRKKAGKPPLELPE